MKRVSSSQNHKLHEILNNLKSLDAEYPEDLLSARRAAFLDQLTESKQVESEKESALADQKVIDLLHRLRTLSLKYPPQMLSARRSAYMRKILWMNWVSFWAELWKPIQEKISFPKLSSRSFSASFMTASLVLAALMGFLFYKNRAPLASLVDVDHGVVKSAHIVSADVRVAKIICKPGLRPPMCLVGEYSADDSLTVQGRGTARAAVAKDSMSGPGNRFMAAYINDGMYGPATSWRSNSKNSWIKIDLGQQTEINTVTFGKDRLGKMNGGNPGQFEISLALSDDIYANGNSHNDNLEYTQVYSSSQAGFNGVISGSETIKAEFAPQLARYIKITFENKGTSIDEVEAFMVQPAVTVRNSNKDSKDKQSRPTPTFIPSNTPAPTDTATPVPTDTATSVPTDTPVPTSTATSVPTSTATPVPTSTATSVPTDTPIPTNTATPVPTDTPVPTSTPLPTDTSVPPATNTSVAVDTQMPVVSGTTTPGQGSIPSDQIP